MKAEEKKIKDMNKVEKALGFTKMRILEKPLNEMTAQELQFLAQMEILDTLAGIQMTLNEIVNK